MTPILPESVWYHLLHGVIIVVHSDVVGGEWEITFKNRENNVTMIYATPEKWREYARYICTVDELDQTYDKE